MFSKSIKIICITFLFFPLLGNASTLSSRDFQRQKTREFQENATPQYNTNASRSPFWSKWFQKKRNTRPRNIEPQGTRKPAWSKRYAEKRSYTKPDETSRIRSFPGKNLFQSLKKKLVSGPMEPTESHPAWVSRASTSFYKYGPAQVSRARTSLPFGTKVTVLGNKSGWIYVKLNSGQMGYVDGRNLRNTPPEKRAASSSAYSAYNNPAGSYKAYVPPPEKSPRPPRRPKQYKAIPKPESQLPTYDSPPTEIIEETWEETTQPLPSPDDPTHPNLENEIQEESDTLAQQRRLNLMPRSDDPAPASKRRIFVNPDFERAFSKESSQPAEPKQIQEPAPTPIPPTTKQEERPPAPVVEEETIEMELRPVPPSLFRQKEGE